MPNGFRKARAIAKLIERAVGDERISFEMIDQKPYLPESDEFLATVIKPSRRLEKIELWVRRPLLETGEIEVRCFPKPSKRHGGFRAGRHVIGTSARKIDDDENLEDIPAVVAPVGELLPLMNEIASFIEEGMNS